MSKWTGTMLRKFLVVAIVMAGTLEAVAQDEVSSTNAGSQPFTTAWIFEEQAFGEDLDMNTGAALDCIVRGGNWEDCVADGAQQTENSGNSQFIVSWLGTAGFDGTAYEEAYREVAQEMIEEALTLAATRWFEVFLQGPRWGVSGVAAGEYVMTVPKMTVPGAGALH